jgi:hypothetical protein
MSKRLFPLTALALLCCFCSPTHSFARGVTPYLPLNLSPEIERQIERVLVLGDKPIMRRPIAAATVLDALPKACEKDAALCERVRKFLQVYMGEKAVTQLQGSLALTDGTSEMVVPNEHGMKVDSPWSAAVSAYYQLGDYILINLGGVAYDGRATPTGSVVSLGFSFAQLDIGFRDHWLSPLSDSSTLISTEAPTMPSLTLSNYDPISPLGISYEIFLAQMSWQDGIRYGTTTTSGNPSLSGVHIAVEPVSGYSLGVSRIYQYGGGARGSGASGFFDSIFSSSNTGDTGNSVEFGNQVASISSSIVFPGSVPFAVRLEYAGDDNAYAGPLRLGVTNMSVGLDFPKLWNRYDLSFEVSEWQQVWYQHHIYPEGLRHEGIVIGHWFGESKVFTDQVFGDSQSIALGVQLSSGYLRARYRTLANADYSPVPYQRSHDLTINYTTSLRGYRVGAELNFGQDVFGDAYSRLGVTMDLAGLHNPRPSIDVDSSDDDVTEYFVDAGLSYSQAFERIVWFVTPVWTDAQAAPHIGIGARRKVSERSDLGVRLEFDKINDRPLYSVRALDYRYRLNRHIAATGFFGFSRLEIFDLPAYGYYFGAGLQWRNLLKDWDLGIDYRMNDKLTRTKVLPSDPYYGHVGGIYVDTRGTLLSLSYRF